MTLLDAALELAQHGYEVFPLTPRSKVPFAPFVPHGVKNASADATLIRRWWTEQPDCNIGIRCRNLLVLDLDLKKNGTGADDFNAIIAELGKPSAGPISFTGSGGWHLFFARPAVDIVGRTKIIWQGRKTGIDIRVGDQYIVAPPSVHPNGSEYAWHVPPSPAERLPSLPDTWIEHALPHRTRAKSHTLPPVALPPLESTSGLIDRCRAYVAAMPPAIQGQSGHGALLKVANVIFHGFGLSESEGWPIMLEYNSRCMPPWDLGDPKDEKDFRRKMHQARDKPIADYPFGHFREPPASRTSDVDTSALEQQCRDIMNDTPGLLAFGETIPDHLTRVPGFIDTFVAFCMKGSSHPNRPLAFGGALALLAFLTIRKIETVDGIKPNIYIVAIAGSGVGKDYARNVIEQVLNRTGQGHFIGKDIASAEGIEDDILGHKKMIYLTDEIDHLFKNIATGKESRYTNTVSILLRMFSSAGSMWHKRAKAASGKKQETPDTCNQPGLILFGTATQYAFLSTLTPELLISGFGSRCIILEGDPRSRTNHDAIKPDQVPQELIEAAEFWRDFTPVNPATGKPDNLYNENPTPLAVDMTDEAKQIGREFCEHADDQYERSDNPIKQVMWSRVYEIAKKLALLYACSRDREHPVIDADAAQWGCRVSEWMFTNMMTLVDANVAENPFDALCQKIFQTIKNHRGAISRKELTRRIRIKSRELDEALVALIEREQIECHLDAGKTKPALTYKLIQ